MKKGIKKMKINNRKATIKRLSTYLLTMLVLASILSISTFAAGGTPTQPSTPTNPGIVLKSYDGNTIARYIINSLVGLLTLSGVVWGFVRLISAFQNDDEKEKRIAGLGILASLLLGAVVIGVVEMMLA